ncbi:hypothetical protein ABPG72_009652 [Tetrahymena utriculariae]
MYRQDPYCKIQRQFEQICSFCNTQVVDPLVLNCNHEVCFSCACQNEKICQNQQSAFIECVVCKSYTFISQLQFCSSRNKQMSKRFNLPQDYLQKLKKNDDSNLQIKGECNFIRMARQQGSLTNLQSKNINEQQYGMENQGINYLETGQKDQSYLDQNSQLSQTAIKQSFTQNVLQKCQAIKKNKNQSASPQVVGRCSSEFKLVKPTHNSTNNSNYNNNKNFNIANSTLKISNFNQLKSNQNPSSSYLNIFSSRQNQQPQQISFQQESYDNRSLKNNCITPEKIAEKVLDMSLVDSSKRCKSQRNYTVSPNKFIAESPIYKNNTQQKPYQNSDKLEQQLPILQDQMLKQKNSDSLNQNFTAQSQTKKTNIELSECNEHNEPYSLFCETDKKLCCVNCVYKGQGSHKNHNVIPLKQSFNMLKQELGNFKSKQKDKLHQIDEAIRIQTLNKQEILKTFLSFKEVANKEFQKLIQAIQQRQQVVLEDINSSFSQKLMETDDNLRLLQEIRVEFKNFKDIDSQLRNANFQQQVKVYSAKQQLSKSLKVFEGISIIENTKEEINLFDFQAKHQILQDINQLGRIKNTKKLTYNQALQKSTYLSNYNVLKQSSSFNGSNLRAKMEDDNAAVGLNQMQNLEQNTTQRNLDLKLSLNAAGVRASLETPSGQKSTNSRQRYYQSNTQKSISPSQINSANQIQQQPKINLNQIIQSNSHINSILPAKDQIQKQNSIIPPQMDYHMNTFVADQFNQQNTVQTERQSCSSQVSKKSFMFNDKPPLNVIKKQQNNFKNQVNNDASLSCTSNNLVNQTYNNQIKETKQAKENHSSSQLFLSNDANYLNTSAQNNVNKALPLEVSTNKSDASMLNQVLYQTQSGHYSTKKTQYSSHSQNPNNGKFASLSAQIKQITQNVPDYFENDDRDVIEIQESDKENALQEPEEQMRYLNSVNTNSEQKTTQPKQQEYSNLTKNTTTAKQSYLIKQTDDSNNTIVTNFQQEAKQRPAFQKSLSQNILQTKVFEDKTYQILNQTNSLSNNTTNSCLLNTIQISNKQPENLKNIQNSYTKSNPSQIQNKKINGNKQFFNDESMENSSEGNQELIQQLNAEILYENFTFENEQRKDTLSAQLIESKKLKVNDSDQVGIVNTEQVNICNSFQQNNLNNNQSTLFNQSKILDSQSRNSLLGILPFKLKSSNLLYSMKDDKLSSDDFHDKCDGRGPYIILIKANSFTFGYYSPISFVQCDKYITCSNSFIFSLSNIYNTQPLIFPVKHDKKFIALYQSIKNPCLGSTLQNKQDLWINFDDPRNSVSCLGYAYQLDGQYEGSKILAGQYTDWNVQGIEIYQVIQ